MLDRARPIKELLRDPVDPARTQALWQRLRDRRPSRVRTALPFALATSLAALALFVIARQQAPSAPFGGQVPVAAALSLRDGSAIPASITAQGAARRLELSDASTIELDPLAELHTLSSSATAFATELVRGGARFAVTPGGPRAWSVRAGSVEVRVIGTAFRVEHEAGEVAVSVEHGVVAVSGVTVQGGRRELRAGQALRVRAERVLELAATPQPSAGDAEARAEVAAERAPPAAVGVRGAGAKAQPPRAPVAAERAPAPGVEELLAAADRERAAGDREQAARSLAALLEHHPHDARAPLAALTLGRLYVQLGRPVEAVSVLERSAQLGLPQALAEEGAAFLVLAHARAGQLEQARSAAARYHAAFPTGRWSASVQQWAPSP